MKFREPTKLHRKSGDVGHPVLVAGIERKSSFLSDLCRRHVRHTRVYWFAILNIDSCCIVFVSIYRSDNGLTSRRAQRARR
jgi:hypothetical protein